MSTVDPIHISNSFVHKKKESDSVKTHLIFLAELERDLSEFEVACVSLVTHSFGPFCVSSNNNKDRSLNIFFDFLHYQNS